MESYQSFHRDYPYLFNSYYEGAGERVSRVDRGFVTRPTLEELKTYRAYVDEHMLEYLGKEQFSEKQLEVLQLGLQHEQQHQELLVYDIKYILGHQPLYPPYINHKALPESNVPAPLEYLQVSEGKYQIGYDGSEFCFDNELGVHEVYLQNFEIGNRLISVGEYMEFIEDGGYQDFRHWLSEGWEWVKANGIKAPHYWHYVDGGWQYYSLYGMQSLRKDEPLAHISYFEADAFARWKGERLPTEFEWEVACKQYGSSPTKAHNFADNRQYHPIYGDPANQFMGNLWEWTSSSYLPYPYFKTEEGAIGEYNGKWMVNQMVLRGGSYATSRDHIRPTYRNFFHPHLRWLCNGIRLARHV